jgi:thiosulfate/3-mercaptopyruvate sulfurtransferase
MSPLEEPAAIQAHLEDPRWVLVDCRFDLARPEWGRAEWRQATIPGAAYAHLDADLSGPVAAGKTGRHPLPDPDAFARRLSSWGVQDGVRVVAFDQAGGGIAARLWWMLRWLGHDAVQVLDGGWARWIAEGRRTAPGLSQPRRANFVTRPRQGRTVDASAVTSAARDPGVVLLDARGSDRFLGQNETIDPVAGHIPGAISAPFADNLSANGVMLEPGALRLHYETLLGGAPAEQAICYCGSGVTACHDILAMVQAGLPEPRLYPGSFSEWITDPTRPVS